MLRTVRSALVFAFALCGVLSLRADTIASATYFATQSAPGVFTYSLTLNNTGTTNIGTFWFSWVPGAGYLSPVPFPGSITSPAGWTFTPTNGGAAIRWVTTTSLLASGASLSGFSFTSVETPAQLAMASTVNNLTNPGNVFFVYEGAPLTTPSYRSLATQVTPEPESLALVLTGACGVAAALRRRRIALEPS